MRNTSKIAIRSSPLAALLLLLACSQAALTTKIAICRTRPDESKAQATNNGVQSRFCAAGKPYALTYNRSKHAIVLDSPSGQSTLLEDVPKDLAPEQVGGEEYIRFLPLPLQPYLDRSNLIYLSSLRSADGDGSGQCGAGVEIFINIISVENAAPARVARLPISSCLRSIEMSGGELIDPPPLSAVSVEDGRLTINFMIHGDQSGPAILSDDYSKFIFRK